MCLKRLIKCIDAMLRRRQHIYVFADDPENILRISKGRAAEDLVLSDGAEIHQGDPIVLIHYWNEHIPPVPDEGESFGWGLAYTHRLAHTFRLLAAYIRETPDMHNAEAIMAEGTWGSPYTIEQFSRFLGRWGFDVIPLPEPATLWGRFVRFWEHVYSLALVWAYDPGSLVGHPWHFRREAIWMSRETLLGNRMPWARVRRRERSAPSESSVSRANVES